MKKPVSGFNVGLSRHCDLKRWSCFLKPLKEQALFLKFTAHFLYKRHIQRKSCWREFIIHVSIEHLAHKEISWRSTHIYPHVLCVIQGYRGNWRFKVQYLPLYKRLLEAITVSLQQAEPLSWYWEHIAHMACSVC